MIYTRIRRRRATRAYERDLRRRIVQVAEQRAETTGQSVGDVLDDARAQMRRKKLHVV